MKESNTFVTLTVTAVGLMLATIGLSPHAAALVFARMSPEAAQEETISGTLTTTRTIARDARLTGDVGCTMTGAPCIQFGASGITLNLNGFTITGLADPSTGCSDGPTANELGIDTNGRSDITIQGPGLVQQFRGQGVSVSTASVRARIASVTSSTNCGSGIILRGSENLVEDNFLVRNGQLAAACGGV
jgi:hypothetical protein